MSDSRAETDAPDVVPTEVAGPTDDEAGGGGDGEVVAIGFETIEVAHQPIAGAGDSDSSGEDSPATYFQVEMEDAKLTMPVVNANVGHDASVPEPTTSAYGEDRLDPLESFSFGAESGPAPEPGALATEPEDPEPDFGGYIKVEGITGEADDGGHDNWINVQQVGDAVLQPASGAADPGPSEVAVDPAHSADAGDQAEPPPLTNFEEYRVKYTEYDSENDPATLETTDPASQEDAYELTNVMVTSYGVGGSGGDAPVPTSAELEPDDIAIDDWGGEDDDAVLASLEPTGELARAGVAGDDTHTVEDLVEGGGLEILDL